MAVNANSLVGMMVNVTALGTSGESAQASISGIVDYLEGKEPTLTGDGQDQHYPGGTETEPVGRGEYYIDSGPGTWLGEGVSGAGYELSGPVDRKSLERLLGGADPQTGERLMHSVGSSSRSNASKVDLPEGDGPIQLTTLANHLGVDDSYLRRIARKTSGTLVKQEESLKAGLPAPKFDETYLVASKEGKRWVVSRKEADRFISTRVEPRRVVGYDVTWSVPKSVSVLAANSTPEIQAKIYAAIDHSVMTGMGYLEREGLWVRQGRDQTQATGMVGAMYDHRTSRAGEPQLHRHVVIANMATDKKTGNTQAIDARGLYAYASTAGHLASAELRRTLTEVLGVRWGEVDKGSAEIEGVPVAAMREMSSRTKEINEEVRQTGGHTREGRTNAALKTRKPKTAGLNEEEVIKNWRYRLAAKGFTMQRAVDILNQQRPSRRAEKEILTELSSATGVTERHAIFDRRDVLKKTADIAGTHYDTAQIEELADLWLRTEAVQLDISNNWEVIGSAKSSGKVKLSHETVYSTPGMVDLEQRVLALHKNGIDRKSGQINPVIVEQKIVEFEQRNGFELGKDQARAVRSITTSGHQFQAVQGLAGAGKTTALSAAIDAWDTQGFNVIGIAPYGSAVKKLGDEIDTKIETRTLESLLTLCDHNEGSYGILGPETVLIVDEASTISNRQMARLYKHCDQSGATVRTIGDPQQHKSVEAGGLWNAVVKANPDSTPRLDVNRRQNKGTMGGVRAALKKYRNEEIPEAVKMLDQDGRFLTAPSWEEMLSDITRQWEPHFIESMNTTSPTQIIAERHRDRNELNELAQHRLRSSGLLTNGIEIGEATFHKGDFVVAQQSSKELKPVGKGKQQSVINGSLGKVVGFAGDELVPDLVVEFHGLGEVRVPHAFIAQSVGAGRGGGLEPAYAVTSHKAQGQTWDSAFAVAAPGATKKEGFYVAITRAKNNLVIGSIDPNKTPERVEAEFKAPEVEKTMTEALTATLLHKSRPDVASVAAPTVIGQSTSAKGIRQLIKNQAVASPTPSIVSAIGERPTTRGLTQQTWEHAAEIIALEEYENPQGQPTRTRIAAIENYEVEQVAVQPLSDLVDKRATQQVEGANSTETLEDKAFDLLVNRAVESPSKYLTEAIGTRPDEDDQGWVAVATRIERERHNSKLTPAHGRQLGNSPLAKAVGKEAARNPTLKSRANRLMGLNDRNRQNLNR